MHESTTGRDSDGKIFISQTHTKQTYFTFIYIYIYHTLQKKI